MNAVEFDDVTFRAGGRDILKNFNLAVAAGETVVLLGRSGSGKTSALKLVNAMNRESTGTVRVTGRPTAEWNAIELRRHIGYVMQDAGLFPHYTVAANVGLVPRLLEWPRERIEGRVQELLELVGLPFAEFGQRYPRQLSGGQRQRVGVARALAADPAILLLDEPFGALDPITRAELQREFVRLRDSLGKTALFVTHDVREALKVGTRIALIEAGRVAVADAPREFEASEHPEARAFLKSLE
jgi:osmoprotectant transport system ATP-binding protein